MPPLYFAHLVGDTFHNMMETILCQQVHHTEIMVKHSQTQNWLVVSLMDKPLTEQFLFPLTTKSSVTTTPTTT